MTAVARQSSFAPVVGPETRLLVLGSLPGQRSLAAGQYYAHPQNRFWHLMRFVVDIDLPSLDYDNRLQALRQAGVGLWDTVASAVRAGSLDAAIRDPEHNALLELAGSLPRLRAVGLNGATAARIGRKLLADSGLALIALPSSSPAYAAMPLAVKERHWRALAKYLS